GRSSKKNAEAIFDTLGRLAEKDKRAADAQFFIADRAARLKREAGDALLRSVDGILRIRSGNAAELADLLAAAADARPPIAALGEVEKLAKRKRVSAEALATLGAKARLHPPTVDIAWLNRTRLGDVELNFLAQDKRTPWNDLKDLAADPMNGKLMKDM